MAYVVSITARKLRPYFDAHSVQILTNHPLKKVMHKLESSGRILKWDIEFSKFELEFKPTMAIKAPALADFIIEATYEEEVEEVGTWKISVDGSSTQHGSGFDIVMTSPEGHVFEYAIRFSFKASNNESEYEATLAGLRLCLATDATKVHLFIDSQLVGSQINGEYKANEPIMIKYHEMVREMTSQL